MSSIDIVPIGEADGDILTRVGYRAFADDLLNKRLYNLEDPTPSQLEKDLQWRIKRNERRMYAPGGYWFKAIESSTGKPVGYCGIQEPEKGKAKGLDAEDQEVLPETMNRELYDFVSKKGKELREKLLGERDDYWYVPSMAVDPEFQGHGIASRLLKKLCELADQAGQDVYLEGTTAALRLYKKAGFEVLEEVEMLEGVYRLALMLRKPQPTK